MIRLLNMLYQKKFFIIMKPFLINERNLKDLLQKKRN